MRLLIACECSGVVRDAFTRECPTWDVWSCDLQDSWVPGKHITGDVREVLRERWDMMIAHPPCNYLCSSGLHWNKRRPGRSLLTEAALEFVKELMSAPIHRIAIENPIGCISTRIRKADQIIQPHQFGEDASKATCLWLTNLPKLLPTKNVPPRIVNGAKRWGNQTDSGQNKLGPSEKRSAERSTTYAGIARAMSMQWGILGGGKS